MKLSVPKGESPVKVVKGALAVKWPSAVYSMCAVSCESNVTAIKMEAGLPIRAFRSTGQTTSMMCWR